MSISAGLTLPKFALLATTTAVVDLVADEPPTPAQGWTIMALLAAVVLGIGGGMVRAMLKASDRMDGMGKTISDAINNNTIAVKEEGHQIATLAKSVETAQTSTTRDIERLATEVRLLATRVGEQHAQE